MQSTLFAVGDDPYCLWEEDVAARTKDFLEGLDPDFFEYLLKVHGDADDEKRASVALRLALHHGTETLFSLLGAFIQAPDCPYAWIARCSNQELRDVVRRVSAGDQTLLTKLKLSRLDWEQVSMAVLQAYEPGTVKQEQTARCFAQLWAELAREFTSEVHIDEYNAMKHGFRTRSGGFTLRMAREDANRVAPPESEAHTLGHSQFGARFFKLEKVIGKGGRHVRTRRTSVNWSTDRDVLLLQLVHFSINNVISGLKVINDLPPGSCTFVRPEQDDDFTRPWKHGNGVSSVNIDFVLDERRLPEVTKEEIATRLRDAT